MATKDFCTSLRLELSAWRDSLDEVLKSFEQVHGPEKARILGNVEDLHMVIEELTERIEQLKITCSIDGFEDIVSERVNFLQSAPNVRDVDHAMEAISAGSFGG